MLEAALALAPEDARAVGNLATALAESGAAQRAIGLLERWLARHPRDADLWNRLGLILHAEGRGTAAASAFERAIAAQPKHLAATSALARLRFDRREFQLAAAAYRRLLELDPANYAAHRNLANLLTMQGRLDEAETLFRRAQKLGHAPGIDFIVATQLPAILPSEAAIDDVRRRYGDRLDALIRQPPALEDPSIQVGQTGQFFLAYHGRDDLVLQRKLAEAYLAACPTLAWRAPYLDRWRPGSRLKIGVVSTYLLSHTIGRVTHGLLERLDKARFEIILFRTPQQRDAIADAVAGTAERVVEISARLAEARSRIAKAALDLLYFPDIGMAPLTYFLAFARLAPVQCIGWGHPDTTGIPNADYWLSADVWEPADGDVHYSERLIRLAHPPVYYPRPSTAPPARSRRDLGLPETGRLYLAPMSLFKFHPAYDDILARILETDSDAHLLLAAGDTPEWHEQLSQRIAKRSPSAARRLLFLPRMPLEDFQALARLGDAFLDPIYFGGGRTSLDVMALGVPIVNWPGPFMRSRITYGFYRQMDMADLVAADHDTYVALALRLARDGNWHEAMRRKTAERSAALYENDAAVRELEAFFIAAVAAAAAGRRLDRWPISDAAR